MKALALLLVSAYGLLPAPLIAQAWQVERSWTSQEERAFGEWVRQIGAREWTSTDQAIRSRQFNSLFDPSDLELSFFADCADLPIVLRAYYSYKRKLPFIYNAVSGPRYTSTPNYTTATVDNVSFEGSVQEFFQSLVQTVHTGNYRTAPEAPDSITYPIRITRKDLGPGAVYYSPEGHVALVTEVSQDGDIFLMDAHPDQSVTRIRFSPKLTWRSVTRSGGFRAFRPVLVSKNGSVHFHSDNLSLSRYSIEQYSFSGDYYSTIRERLATSTQVDPLEALENYIRQDIFSEVLDRRKSVERAWKFAQERAIPIPPNIYDSEGDWETYSSPSRDLRLRRAFMHLPDEVESLLRLCRENPTRLPPAHRNPAELGKTLLARQQQLFRKLSFTYTNSTNKKVRLTLSEVEERLFRLSFDPNHPPELRWGATGPELASASRSETRYFLSYEAQQPWRNRMEKKRGTMSLSDADNPRHPPPHDSTAAIRLLISDV